MFEEGLKIDSPDDTGLVRHIVPEISKLYILSPQACLEVIQTALERHKANLEMQSLLGQVMTGLSPSMKQILKVISSWTHELYDILNLSNVRGSSSN